MFKIYYKGGSWNYTAGFCQPVRSTGWLLGYPIFNRGFRIVVREKTND